MNKDGKPIDPAKLRELRLRNSARASRMTREQKMEQMWAHGSERRPNPYLNGQRNLDKGIVPIDLQILSPPRADEEIDAGSG
ncbi:MAG: hypothetical protein WD342_12455 [Verrucomicrobiales bacterium]